MRKICHQTIIFNDIEKHTQNNGFIEYFNIGYIMSRNPLIELY